MTVEYTVRPVVRYFVTRFQDGVSSGSAWNTGSSYLGTFDNVEQANRVANAMAMADEDPAATAKLLMLGDADVAAAPATAVCRAQLGN